MNIYNRIKFHAENSPNKIAIHFNDYQITYKEFIQQVDQFASFLIIEYKVSKGDVIAIMANNGIEYPLIFIAAAKLGLTLLPLPISQKPQSIKSFFNLTSPKILIAWHSVFKKHDLESIHKISIGKEVDGAKYFPHIFKEEIYNYQETKISTLNLNDPYIISMTSGSTGNPKPIVFSQETKINRSILATKERYGLSDQDVVLTSTPLYHSLAQRCMLLPLLIGGTSIILDKYTPKRWIESIVHHKVSFLFAVSNQLTSILNKEKVDLSQYDFSNLRTLISSSSTLKPEAKEEILNHMKCDLYDCYGTSEIGVATDFSFSQNREKIHTVGAPLPFVDILILDENENIASVGIAGEIAVKTKTKFEGYYNQPETTSNSYYKEEYFLTGDIGKFDEDGFLIFLDRKKDIIITGGVNIYPIDIEKIIKETTPVSDCVAIGVQDELLGEKILLVVEGDKESGLLPSIRKKCIEHLTDYQTPFAFEFVNKLPRTALGKIQRSKLKESFKNYQIKSVLR